MQPARSRTNSAENTRAGRTSTDSEHSWTIRPIAPGERPAVGGIIAAAFAGQYGPALGDDPAIAAEVAAILPTDMPCYVGLREGRVAGTGLLRLQNRHDSGFSETVAVWRALRARQTLGRTLRSIWRMSLLDPATLPDRTTGYISSLAVAPEWQGQGLGGALLDYLEVAARAAGKANLGLHVIETNAGARRLYERHGIIVMRSEPSLFTYRLWGYRALLYMMKRLT